MVLKKSLDTSNESFAIYLPTWFFVCRSERPSVHFLVEWNNLKFIIGATNVTRLRERSIIRNGMGFAK